MISVDKKNIDNIIANSIISVETKFDKCTIVTVQLPNGFVLVESSGAIDINNYNENIGYECCMTKIIDKLWMLEGYALANEVYRKDVI